MAKRRTLRYGLGLFAAVLILVAVELAGRQFPRVMPPDWQLLHAAILERTKLKEVPDTELGFLMPPTAATDRNGFLNEDPWPEHPALVFLGDSLVAGVGVGLVGSFAHLVGRLLPDQPVVNLGLGAAGVERQLLLYRRFALPLHPHLVVSCLYLASDFDNDDRFRRWVHDGRGVPLLDLPSGKPNAYEQTRGLLKKLQFGRLLEKSWLFWKARDFVDRFSETGRVRGHYRFPDGTETLMSTAGVEFATAAASATDPRIEALIEALGRLRGVVEQSGAGFLVVLIPSKEELFGIPEAATSGNLVAHTRERLQQAQFRVLDMYSAIRQGGALQSPYITDDIHLNAFGNRIVADEFVVWFHQHPLTDGSP